MKNIEIFRNNLTCFLQKHRNQLYDSSMKLADQVVNSCFRNMLFDELCDHRYNIISVDIIKSYIENNIFQEKNLMYRQRKVMEGLFGDNEIHFQFYFHKREICYLFNIPHAEYGPRKDQLTKDCVHEFFQNSINSDYYDKVGKWNLYNNKIVSSEDLTNELEVYSVDLDRLNKYLIEIIEHLFSDYKYSDKYSTRYKRFIKDLDEDFALAIEFDAGYFKNLSSTGFLYFPDYLNIVLINKTNFKKKDSPNHILKQRDDILSLGRLGNPFIYILLSLEAYLLNFKLHKKAEYNYEWLSKLPVETVELENGQTEICYNKIYEDQAKRYLMYFLFATAYTAKDYLEYIEICVTDLLNDNSLCQ